MSLLIFGKTGQLARELQRRAPQATYLGREDADLTDPDACAAAIARTDARAVINAAAYTAVDKAEDDEPYAALINGASPTMMARACAARGIAFLHVSSDYVFDGRGDTPHRPNDPTAPLGAYGWTKLAGERGIEAAGGTYAILRTSWVFSAHGSNFVKTMLRLSENHDRLEIVADQIGGPTPAGALAEALLKMAAQMRANGGPSGIYHFSGAPDISWAGFARAIFAQAVRRVDVRDIPSSAYPTPTARPANSRLDCRTLERDFAISRPDWHTDLGDVLTELDAKQ